MTAPPTHRQDAARFLRARYLRLYDRVLRRPGLALVAVVTVSLASAAIIPRMSLDMSFRPLFGQDASALEATRRFEERFGQRSGAWVGVILAPAAWDAAFVEALAAASTEVERLEGVQEVVSLARAAVPVWSPDGVASRWLLEPSALGSVSDEELARVLAARSSPGLAGTLVSADGGRTLLLARLGAPLQDLRGRSRVIRDIREIVAVRLEHAAEARWVGISVVEETYSRLVLHGLAVSLLLTTVVVLGVLYAAYRRAAAVAAIMAGVSLSLPVALAAMVVRGQSVTIVSSMVPTMILIIGVADAIHMFESFAGHVRAGRSREAAVREMFGDMALPCLLTTLTTIAGVLALQTARIEALRDFGSDVAVGIAAVYVANLIALPAILRLLPLRRVLAPARASSAMATWRRRTGELLVRRSGSVLAWSAVVVAFCALGIATLDVDQRFNEDVAADHPVRVAQSIYERDFGGILGPDLVVRRRDGGTILGASDRERLADLVSAVAALPGVLRVESALDFVPSGADDGRALSGALALRDDAKLAHRMRNLVDAEGERTAIVVRTADTGSRAALELVARIEALASRELGDAYEAEVVGQWWLAQLGLSELLHDMLTSFATSFVVVLPILALALASGRLFAVAILPNLLPPLFALGFMGWMGISVRVGTAMILAIALAIAVDDTIHVLVRLGRERLASPDPGEQVRRAVDHTAGPLLLTTMVLVAGFLSMRLNGLVAIQDMGIVAAATLSVAFLADLYLLPALYLVGSNRARRAAGRLVSRATLREVGVADTSNDV